MKLLKDVRTIKKQTNNVFVLHFCLGGSFIKIFARVKELTTCAININTWNPALVLSWMHFYSLPILT